MANAVLTRTATPARRRSRGISERRLAVLMVAPSMTLIALVAVVISIPLIALVLLFQKRIVAGLTAGAVKG